MDSIDFENEVDLALTYGLINDYAAQKLLAMSKSGLTEELWQKAIDNYREASDAGVTNDKAFAAFFYIDLFADDLLKSVLGTKLSKEESGEFKKFLFENREHLNLADIASFKAAAKEWTDSHKALLSEAHPNIGRIVSPEKAYDLNKWATLFVQIQNLIRVGLKPGSAFDRVASSLSIPEKYDFLIWARNNMRGEFEKYNVNTQIRNRERKLRGDAITMKNKIASDGQYYYIPKFLSAPEQEPAAKEMPVMDHDYDEQYAIDFETARNKLMSRVFAIDKLLEKYRRVIKHEQVDAVEEALAELRKRIRKLRLASTLKDSIIKTANRLNKLDFSDGADELFAIAAEADELTAPGGTKTVTREVASVPPERREVALDEAIKRLTDISAVLKNRDLVRSLAEIDLMLHKLRMSSFFPEIQEAQSKLIDAFGYASNKVEDLLPKLRGGLQAQPDIVSEPGVVVEPQSTEQKQLGEEVRQMSSAIKSPRGDVAEKKTPPTQSRKIVEDESFEDEPVNLRTVPGLE